MEAQSHTPEFLMERGVFDSGRSMVSLAMRSHLFVFLRRCRKAAMNPKAENGVLER